MGEEIPRKPKSSIRGHQLGISRGLLLTSVLLPYGLLMLLSLGSGWSFPNLLPDRINGAPWLALLLDHDGLRRAGLWSLLLSGIVGGLSTFLGLLGGRAIRRSQSDVWRFFIYLPFVCSPIIASTSLYDLLIRLKLVGTVTGIVLSQSVFATSFAVIFFSELWTDHTQRLERLVRSLGGGTAAVWRHVVIPEGRGLILICFCQSALYSWLDYGLVTLIGGGKVVTLPLKFFGYIREASVNHAAMASLVLLFPVGLCFLLTITSRVFARFRP